MRLASAAGASFVAGLAAMSWSALVLAEFGRFSPPLPLAAFPLAAGLAWVLLTRGQRGPGGRAGLREDLIAAGIACATLLFTVPPDEILLGGQDQGVYVHTAASIVRTGSLIVTEPDITALGAEDRALVSRDFIGIGQPFPGMWQLPDGRITLQFYHLYPSLMAVAWALGGVRAALLVNPLLNVAAILALYALVALLFGRRWALGGALVHALATAQLRQAKFPTAEMLTQFLLLAGVALLARALLEKPAPPFLAPLAGIALGLATLTRYDAVVFLVPFVVALVWGARGTPWRPLAAAVAPIAALFVHSWLHQRNFTPYYLPLGGLFGPVVVAAALLCAAALLLQRTRAWESAAAAVLRRERALRWAAAALFVAWALFGWFVRPRLAGPGRIGQAFRSLVGDFPPDGFAGVLSGAESGNLLYVLDLLGPAGLIAAVAGVAALIVTRRRLWEGAWTAASVAVLIVVTFNVYNDHVMMWVSRRFVPVVAPLASVGIVAAAARLSGARPGGSMAWRAAGVGLIAAVLAFNAGGSRAMAREREWPGLIGWYERLERDIPAGAEVYSDQPGFAAPLRFVYGHRAYELAGRNPERLRKLIALMRRRAAGRTVLYLTQERLADAGADGLTAVGAYPLRSSTIAVTRRGVPSQTKARGGDFTLYRVQPA